jgi:hypothetical protein
MISKEYGIIHVHIPRTAGHFVLDLFNIPNNVKHISAQKIKDKHPIEWERYFKFTIVRNPWDRYLSIWYGILSNCHNVDKYKDFITSDEFFNYWKNNCKNLRDKISYSYNDDLFLFFKEEFNNFVDFTKEIHGGIFKSMYDWLAINNSLEHIDYVGKFENLDKVFIHLKSKFNLSNQYLPFNNSKSNKIDNYRLYYNTESIDIIAKKYKRDIKKFRYEF